MWSSVESEGGGEIEIDSEAAEAADLERIM